MGLSRPRFNLNLTRSTWQLYEQSPEGFESFFTLSKRDCPRRATFSFAIIGN